MGRIKGWTAKGKNLYEKDDSPHGTWLGIGKQPPNIWGNDRWYFVVKRRNGDILAGGAANTQREIRKRAISYMRSAPEEDDRAVDYLKRNPNA